MVARAVVAKTGTRSGWCALVGRRSISADRAGFDGGSTRLSEAKEGMDKSALLQEVRIARPGQAEPTSGVYRPDQERRDRSHDGRSGTEEPTMRHVDPARAGDGGVALGFPALGRDQTTA
jgi:hypothetical protein